MRRNRTPRRLVANMETNAKPATSLPLTPAQLRELRSIERDGNPSDPYDWTHAPDGLWFHARERVLGALLRKGLIYEPPTMSGYAMGIIYITT